MNINQFSLISILGICLLMSQPVEAKRKTPKKKTSDAPEVYSATEDDSPGAISLGDKGLWEDEGKQVKAEPLKGGMMSSTEEKKTEDTLSIPVKINEFDPVTPNQVDSISSRIRLVEQIIRKHKRAYDYRSNTTLELIEVMKYLDKTAAASKK